MIGFIKKMLGGNTTDFKALLSNGAQIIDVRSREEFQGGNIKGSVNIPLPFLPQQLSKIKKDKPVITCCASGMRSEMARSVLQKNGFEAYNGGGWSALKNKLNYI